jgi:hypothetical protein
MKLRQLFLITFFCIVTLFGCAKPINPQVNQNLLQETWMRSINLHPMIWTRDGDRWFFTGEPYKIESYANRVPNDKAMSVMAVKVPEFTNVVINGCFQVQITGGQERNSVSVVGPNDDMRQIMVHVEGNTVLVTQQLNEKGGLTNLKSVIVRINIRNLRLLKVNGAAKVEGHAICSDGLTVIANNKDTVLLSGQKINVVKINNLGSGTISVINAYSPCLDILVSNSGTVNINGRIGIRTINNLGSGTVNIIGADSRSLVIKACGSSITKVAGYANLKHLTATGSSCVNLYWVKSNGARIVVSQNARVGLAGCITHLDLYATDNARFGGQYLHSNDIYVQTHGSAHANIAADKKIFASATDNSSVYFFGSPSIVSRFTSDHGSVIPVWNETNSLPVPAYAPQFITSVNRPGNPVPVPPLRRVVYK